MDGPNLKFLNDSFFNDDIFVYVLWSIFGVFHIILGEVFFIIFRWVEVS